jgi:hypothetical protein
MLAQRACIAYYQCMQYTIRGIPGPVDEAIRRRARTERRSLNEVAIEALAEGIGLGREPVVRRDLSDVAGTWKADASIEAALQAQDTVDEDIWK